MKYMQEWYPSGFVAKEKIIRIFGNRLSNSQRRKTILGRNKSSVIS